jgi:hypothetical protein
VGRGRGKVKGTINNQSTQDSRKKPNKGKTEKQRKHETWKCGTALDQKQYGTYYLMRMVRHKIVHISTA